MLEAKSTAAFVALLSLFAGDLSCAFAPSQDVPRGSNLFAATIETAAATTISKSLKSPMSLETQDIMGLYEERVQKTYGRVPLTLKSGLGCKLTSVDGKDYLDFVSGIATCALGHANPELIEAVSNQMKQMHHDPVIITAIDSFHGRTLAALSATAQPKYHKGFTYGGKMVQGFEYVPYNNVEDLEKMVNEMNKTPFLDKLKGRKRGVAAIMMEALQGEGGIKPGNPEFFKKARELCDESNALLILDEVQVGMGRTGTLWGYEQLGVIPDVFTSAKALGGGVPIGAMMARGECASELGPGDHASTYGGNPLACAAGLAVAQYLSDKNVLDNVNARGDQLSAGLESIAAKYPKVLGQVRGWGLLKGVVVQPGAGCMPGEVVADAMTDGLLLVPAGKDVVRFVPPLIVSEQEVKDALSIFEKVVAARAEKLGS
eukprot:scaffold16449_cov51-Attheya_sp.AAC.1